MKRNRIIVFALSIILGMSTLYSQGVVDASRIIVNDVEGSARSVAMGGAFGALGGDISGVNINPAGLGVYRSSEFVTTLDYKNDVFGNLSLSSAKQGLLKGIGFNNFGIVGYLPTYIDEMPNINFSFTYNNSKKYNKRYRVGNSEQTSLMRPIAHYSSLYNADPHLMKINSAKEDPFYNPDLHWLSVFGFNSYLMKEDIGNTPSDHRYHPLHNNPVVGELAMQESGSMNNYDFSVATTIFDKISLGATITIAEINYNLESVYSENFGNNNGFDLKNTFSTKASGVGMKLGVIYRPINEIRLGVSYHSPIKYSVRNNYSARLDDRVSDYWEEDIDSKGNKYEPAYVFSGNGHEYEYNTRIPGKLVLSAAGIISNNFIISVDYEMTNNGNIRFVDDEDFINGELHGKENRRIEENFGLQKIIRAGSEFRITKQFSARVGCAFMDAPYKGDNFKNGNITLHQMGSLSHFVVEGKSNLYTFGVGYRFSRQLYMDFATIFRNRNDLIYAFPNVIDGSEMGIAPYKFSANSTRMFLTLGYKF